MSPEYICIDCTQKAADPIGRSNRIPYSVLPATQATGADEGFIRGSPEGGGGSFNRGCSDFFENRPPGAKDGRAPKHSLTQFNIILGSFPYVKRFFA